MKRSTYAAMAAVAVAMATVPSVKATTIFPPHSIVAGQSIGDWNGGWWTWVSEMPTSGNPFDTNGALAHQNNNGPVFYVVGNSGGVSTRSFSVLAGKPLLFPLVNYSVVQYPVALGPVDKLVLAPARSERLGRRDTDVAAGVTS
jgi:hypothetical protein